MENTTEKRNELMEVVHTAMHSALTLAKLISRKREISLSFANGEEMSTSWDVLRSSIDITLPKRLLLRKDELLLSALCHECGHVLYSNQNLFDGALSLRDRNYQISSAFGDKLKVFSHKLDPMFQRFLNVFEDIRIEHLMRGSFLNARYFLQKLFVSIDEQPKAPDLSSFNKVCLTLLRRMYTELLGYKSKGQEVALNQHESAAVDRILSHLKDREAADFLSKDDFAVRYLATAALCEILRDPYFASPPEQGQSGADKAQNGQGSTGQGELQPDPDSQQSPEDEKQSEKGQSQGQSADNAEKSQADGRKDPAAQGQGDEADSTQKPLMSFEELLSSIENLDKAVEQLDPELKSQELNSVERKLSDVPDDEQTSQLLQKYRGFRNRKAKAILKDNTERLSGCSSKTELKQNGVDGPYARAFEKVTYLFRKERDELAELLQSFTDKPAQYRRLGLKLARPADIFCPHPGARPFYKKDRARDHRTHLCLLLDRSGSTGSADLQYVMALGAAARVLNKSEVLSSAFTFNSTASRLKKVNEPFDARIFANLCRPGGNTCPDEAVSCSINDFRKSDADRKIMLLITDGCFDPDKVNRLLQENPDVEAFGIYVDANREKSTEIVTLRDIFCGCNLRGWISIGDPMSLPMALCHLLRQVASQPL